MIFGLFRKNKVNHAVMVRQYDALNRAARIPAFFEGMNVPDTVMGRFEMLSVSLILYFRRTASAGEQAKAIAQEIVEDLEAALEQFRLIAGDLAGAEGADAVSAVSR